MSWSTCGVSLDLKMASFLFNFNEKESVSNETVIPSDLCEVTTETAKEIKVPEDVSFWKADSEEIIINEVTRLRFMKIEHVEERLKELKKKESSRVLDASLSNTDLVPAVYEGGLKIWECAVNLVEFLEENKVKFEDERVLEAGCGAGLPGIFSLLKGACVDFQDYNYEVIENFTIPNVFMNLKSTNAQYSDEKIRNLLSTKCCFYSGDWKSLESYINPDKIPDQQYDIILSSETIYDIRNQKKFLDFIRAHLKNPSGLVYLAAKTYYFGVGGGTRAFEKLVNESEDLYISVSKVYTGGVKREILTMTWK